MNRIDLGGRIAIVTGAARGIGRAIHSIVCGRACPGHPRSAADALPVFVDARHKAGHERLGRLNHLNGSEH